MNLLTCTEESMKLVRNRCVENKKYQKINLFSDVFLSNANNMCCMYGNRIFNVKILILYIMKLVGYQYSGMENQKRI